MSREGHGYAREATARQGRGRSGVCRSAARAPASPIALLAALASRAFFKCVACFLPMLVVIGLYIPPASASVGPDPGLRGGARVLMPQFCAACAQTGRGPHAGLRERDRGILAL